jgi:hypothetical protein
MAKMTKKAEFQERIGIQMDHLKAGLMELRAKTRKAKLEARLEVDKGVAALEKKHKDLKAKLGEWKRVGKVAGKDLQKGIERSARELKKAIQNASERLK